MCDVLIFQCGQLNPIKIMQSFNPFILIFSINYVLVYIIEIFYEQTLVYVST